MTFPHDLLRFLYWIFFKPFSLRRDIHQLDPSINNTAALFTRSLKPAALPLRNVALFYILVMPLLLGSVTGLVLERLGMDVNWLKLVFYLLVLILLSTSFSLGFCIVFLLPVSILVAIWSSTSLTPALGVLLSLVLGLAYGLSANSAKWGLIAGIVYGIVLGFILGPRDGLAIGAAFLAGYFRIIFYVIEAPLAWTLATRAPGGDASRLWRFQPLRWDELIWLPLPRLDRHLLALQQQNAPEAQAAVRQVQESFKQKWAAEEVVSSKK